MSAHLLREIDRLKKMILALGAQVEESVRDAVIAVQERDGYLAEDVIQGDAEIDRVEIEVEEECLKILALHQPVAHDLRFIVGVLKVNNDLERIGDLAVNVAKRARFLQRHDPIAIPFDLCGMAESVQSMLRKSLDALLDQNLELARVVLLEDDKVNAINKEMFLGVKKEIERRPEDVERLIELLRISQRLERIGDLATNIAEDAIYMASGEIVRHRKKELKAQAQRN